MRFLITGSTTAFKLCISKTTQCEPGVCGPKKNYEFLCHSDVLGCIAVMKLKSQISTAFLRRPTALHDLCQATTPGRDVTAIRLFELIHAYEVDAGRSGHAINLTSNKNTKVR